MKRKGTKRIATVCLSLFLACICLASIFAFPLKASAAGSYSSSVNINNSTTIGITNNTTTIQILNINSDLLKEAKKENTALKYVKDNGRDWVNDAVSIAEAIQKSSAGEDVDTTKMAVDSLKKIASSIMGIWGFGGITEALLDGIESLTSSGEAPLSEVQVLSDDIDKRFDAISDQLYDIEDQLGGLSNQVTASANDVLSGTQTQINNLEAKQILREFMMSGADGFNYLDFSNYLYGNKNNSTNMSEAYYILLLEAIQAGESEETIAKYYDKLFESIYNDIKIYERYYYGEVVGLDKSMAAYYYDYLSYNPDLVEEGTTAEYQALLFALDLYTTYVYSYEILEMCFGYQTTNMCADAMNENRQIAGTDSYWYTETEWITYSTIKNELAYMQENLVAAEEQIAEDIAYILNMQNSYIVIDENGDMHNIANRGVSFGNLADGQVVYLNTVPDEICELFELNSNNFKYYVDGEEYKDFNKAIIISDNIHNDDNTFVTSAKYGSAELYSIEFTRIDVINNNPQSTPLNEFSGGSGTLDDPYLISNAAQLYLVERDLNASYQLISDITVTGVYSPIGTEKKPFNGVFDGNGYSIVNLTIESLGYDDTNKTMTPTTGVFGSIGKTGLVKNLTLKALKITSDYQKDGIYPENEISSYYIGGIAGINRGVISNCKIVGNYNINSETTTPSEIKVNRLKDCADSRNVEVYVGGISGNNIGIIEYCSTDNLNIAATSHLYYHNESIHKNEHVLLLGGIAATTTNTIQYCRVSENTVLSAYAKSIANSSDDEKPFLTVGVGGILGDDSMEYLYKVYSKCTISQCKGYVWNEGTYWGSHRYSYKNVSLKQGVYYPTFFPLDPSETLNDFEMDFYYDEFFKFYYTSSKDNLTDAKKEFKSNLFKDETIANEEALNALSGKIISTYDNSSFTPKEESLSVSIELFDSSCDINAEYLTDYFYKLIDKEKKIKNIKFVDQNNESVDATIVGYYGFYTYHESFDPQEITVKVFFYVDDVLMTDEVVLSIKGKELVDWFVDWEDQNFEIKFEKDDSISECLETMFNHGFSLVFNYTNGLEKHYINIDNKDAVTINGLNTSICGEQTITIQFNGYTFNQIVKIKCDHAIDDFVKIGEKKADCQFAGYEIWECRKDENGCGEIIHRNYIMGDHTYVVTSGQPATCHEAGYTQEVCCSVCGTQFVEREWIQALPHNYVSSTESGYKANGSYPAEEYHYCSNGDHYEAHQYTVSEYVDENGTLVYLYSCFCGYENLVPDYNIKTKENGEKPVVVVTNGYVLNVGDEVVVYVQIINNPGFNGATFGIRYDEGLELVRFEEGTIVPQELYVNNEVYDGYNFLWATSQNPIEEDGYLLKLVFKYVSETRKEQSVSVVYGMSNGSDGGFSIATDSSNRTFECYKFMTQSGTISVVEHLPGDVNNDEVVDIMDATYIAWSIVGKEDENGNKIQVNAKYADVNLDGKVDLLDVLAILQSISGRYGTSLLSSDYKLFFDLNGFICDDVDESVMVEFYDENGNRTKWSENVDFAKYEALMKQLGYTFVGWYTRMDCNCVDACSHVVKANDFITYDQYQGNQTLYARWEKNKIIFDMGGADCEQYEQEEFSDNNKQVTVENPTWSYEIKHIVDGERFNGVIYKEFQGWEDENGNIVSTKDQDGNITTIVDLSVVNMGVLKLTAVWSDYKWDVPDISISGYEKVANWYLDTYCSERIDVLDANTINRIKQNNFEIYAKKTALEYSINYTNLKDSGFVPIYNTYTVESDFNFEKNLTSTGYTFKGWYIDNYALKIESIDQVIALGLTDVTLIAKWEANSYDVTFNANGGTTKVTNKSIVYETKYGELPIPERTGYTFDGWFTASNGGTQVTENTTLQVAGNHTLYAHWTPCSYTIVYDLCSSSLQSTPSISKNNTTIIFDANTALNHIPTADGYAFTGWRTENGALLTDKDGKIIATNVSGYITNGKWSISKGVTVYATWIRTTPNAQITTATFSTSVYAEGTYIGVANFSVTGIKVKYNGQYYIYGNAYYCGTLGTTRFNDVDSIYFKNTSNKILMGGVLHWRSSYSDNNESGVAGWDRTLGINSTTIGYRVEDPGKDFAANNETIYLSVTDICVAIGGTSNDLDGVPEIVTDTLSANFYTEDKDNIRITFDLIGIKVQYNNEYYLMGSAFYSGTPGGTRYNDVDGIWLKNMDKAVLLGGTMYWSGSKNDNNESGIAGYNKQYGFNSTTIRYMVEDPGKDFAGNESNIISIAGICVKIGGNASSDTVTPKVSETTFSTTLACESTTMGNITFSVVGVEVKNNGTNALYGNAYYSGTCTGSRFNDVGTLKLNSVSKKVYLGGTIHWFGSWGDNNESGVAGYDKSSSNTSNVAYLQEDPGKDYQGKEGATEISITGICVAVN